MVKLVRDKQAVRVYMKHSRLEFDLECIKNSVNNILTTKHEFVESFRKIREMKMTAKLAENLAKSKLPNFVLPSSIARIRERIEENKPIQFSNMSTTDLKDTYDFITERITHSNNSFDTKIVYESILHRTISKSLEVSA